MNADLFRRRETRAGNTSAVARKSVARFYLPSGQDLQSCFCVPGALSNDTNEPVGHFLQLLATCPTTSE